MSTRKVSDTEIEVDEVVNRIQRFQLDDLYQQEADLVAQLAGVSAALQRVRQRITEARAAGVMTGEEARAARMEQAAQEEAERMAALPEDHADPIRRER